ncbi:hypothetical protein CCR85_00885 [Rhodothalassium salexigens]|uniref:Uncharacterized protein n=1 Tax=Rhodothalassium salexigens DSM 2132 TaxID=1188247 RepID=A0A4R2PL77_RHOSA|nr:hypothetical protein [Rhodothalassium salexigens DSM 2132]MBK5910048.1 hypothetical protein [Rhodothalassium salexigens]TCP36359.1 hypothetical protein EV659_103249 [Rhodothalassium salexigens DSM 2132]
MQRKVTLQARLGRGTFYWVCTVHADSDEEAITAAENLFMEEVRSGREWEFEDFEIDPVG